MKNIWNKYTDLMGKTIFHPQFIMLSYLHEGTVHSNKYSSNKKKVIDIGAGRSPYKNSLVFKNYVGVDPSGQSDIKADAHKLPFKEKSFDIALMFQVLEYLKNPEIAIKEMFRILKKGGYLILTTPFMYPVHDGALDRNRFTKTQIKYLLSDSKFKIIKIYSQGGFFDFWLQSLLVFWFKSAKKSQLLLIPTPLIVPAINILALILRPLGKMFSANDDFPLNFVVVARR